MSEIRMGSLIIKIDDSFPTTVELAEDGKAAESLIEHAVIRIRSDLDPQVRSETLLHELMHFAWHQTNLVITLEEQEEGIIRALSPWLAQVVRVDL